MADYLRLSARGLPRRKWLKLMSEIRDHSCIDAATRDAVQCFMARAKASQVLPGVVVGAVLFGSRVRGEQRPDSDADV